MFATMCELKAIGDSEHHEVNTLVNSDCVRNLSLRRSSLIGKKETKTPTRTELVECFP